jgi:hypothetical protein
VAKHNTKSQNSKQDLKSITRPKTAIEPENIGTRGFSIFIFLFFFSLSLLLYGSTMYNGYSMDDELVTLNQPNVEMGIAGIPKILSSRYSINEKQNYEYRPIALITFAIEYEYFGRNPGVSHFFNILIYAITCFLIYLSIKKIFPGRNWVYAFFAASIFLVMPVHNEVVVSLKNRDEMLSLMFALLALNVFLNLVDRNKLWYIIPGILLMLISFFAKKSAYPLIAVFPFIIIYTRKISWVKVIGGLFVVCICIFIIGKLVITKALERGETVREMFFFENPLYVGNHSIVEVLMMALATFGYYVKMLIVPYPLVAYYGYNTFEGFSFTLNHAIGLIAIGIIFWALYKSYKQNKPVFIGLVFFCVSISMFVNLLIPAVGIVAERAVFTASMGAALVFAELLLMATRFQSSQAGTKQTSIPGTAIFIFIVYLGIAISIIMPRNPAWNSTASLYKTDVLTFPQSTKLYSLLGTVHAQKLRKHLDDLNNPALMNSQDGTPKSVKLNTEELKRETDTVISYYRKSLKIYPDYIPVNNNLGTIYFTFKPMLDSAGYFFSRALELDSTYVEAAYNLANYSEKKASLAVTKYAFVKWLAPDSSKPSNKKVLEEQAKILESYESVIDKINTLKMTLNNTFMDMAAGKTKGDPKGLLLNPLLYYIRENPFIRPYAEDLNTLKMADDLLEGFKFLNQQRKTSELETTVDTIVNRYYFPALKKAINNDKKIDLSKLDPGIVKYAYNKIYEYRNRCIALHKKALRLSPNYVNSYGKLTAVLAQWDKFDELIDMHLQLEKNPKFKTHTIEFNIAETYFAMGNNKKTAEYFISALKRVEKIMKRLKLVQANFAAAGNNYMVAEINNTRKDLQGGVGYFINKFMRELANKQPFETVQIQQLYNMITSL